MALSQSQKVTPPVTTDPALNDYSNIIQQNFQKLFQAAHVHVGTNGVITAAPASNAGSVGDIVLGLVSSSVYMYVKINATTWYRFGPGTKV